MNPAHDDPTNAAQADAAEPVGYPRKRARTRGQLIQAGMVVLARRGPEGATVGEIAAEAHVATGTFYNHFPSLLDLVDTITRELRTGVEIASSTLESIEHDPAVRVAIGALQLLELPRRDPIAAAAFVSLLATVPPLRARIRAVVQETIAAGMSSGRFDVSSATAAADAVLGAAVQWMRSSLANEAGADTQADLLRMILRILGLAEAEVTLAIDRALAEVVAA